ncbi:MAG: acetyltransferase [Phycisphaeraceae bacterium]
MIRADDQTHRPLVIYGAGDHGRVVAEAADAAGWRVLGFLDDARTDDSDLLWPLLDSDDDQLREATFIVGIGDNAARRRIARDLHDAGRTLAIVIHPAASVSPSATLHPGVFVGPGAVVHTTAELDPGVIVNSNAVVEHDCHIHECAHLAPGATLGGNATIGAETLVGLNATILPRIAVGRDCTIGAGAVVTRPIESGRTVRGIPAR